jgi:nucleoid-associated protein YgaU
MTQWNKTGQKLANDTDVVKNFLEKAGAKKVDHYGIMDFGDPSSQEFLEEITTVSHIWGVGDRLSKLAHEHYGDARMWWVIAWFNGRPTDFHCKIGDTIRVPSPLPDVLDQAYDER